jgi:hypothetical protein
MTDVEVLAPRAHHLPAVGATVLAVAVLVGAFEIGGGAVQVGAVLLVQLALVAGWVLTTGTGAGTAVIGVAASAGAVVVLEVPDRPELGGLLAVLGPAFLAVVLEQMLRRQRHDMVATLSSGVLLVCAVSALAALLLLGDTATPALLVVGAALVVGSLVDLVLPRPALAEGVPRGPAGLVLAVLAGAAVAILRRGALGEDAVSAAGYGAVLGGVAALVAVAASFVCATAVPGGDRRRAAALPLVLALLPLAACMPIALGLQTVL